MALRTRRGRLGARVNRRISRSSPMAGSRPSPSPRPPFGGSTSSRASTACPCARPDRRLGCAGKRRALRRYGKPMSVRVERSPLTVGPDRCASTHSSTTPPAATSSPSRPAIPSARRICSRSWSACSGATDAWLRLGFDSAAWEGSKDSSPRLPQITHPDHAHPAQQMEWASSAERSWPAVGSYWSLSTVRSSPTALRPGPSKCWATASSRFPRPGRG